MADGSTDTDFVIPAASLLLNNARKRARMTTRELAAAADIPISTLNIILTGKRWRDGVATVVQPKEEDVARVALVLRVDQEELDAIGYFYASELIRQEVFGEGDGLPDRTRTVADRKHGRMLALVDMLEKFTDAEVHEALEYRALKHSRKDSSSE